LSIGLGGDLNIATFGRENFFLAGTSNDTLNGRRIGGGFAGWEHPGKSDAAGQGRADWPI